MLWLRCVVVVPRTVTLIGPSNRQSGLHHQYMLTACAEAHCKISISNMLILSFDLPGATSAGCLEMELGSAVVGS